MNTNYRPTADDLYTRLIDCNQSVFLSGRSGAGKTYLTRQVIDKLKEEKKSFLIGASTGIAARNLHDSGKTIHSILKLGIVSDIDEYKIKCSKFNPELLELISETDVIIIEEVGALSAKFFDVIIHHLARYKFKGAIFAIGDFFQLDPPIPITILNSNYFYAFQSQFWFFYSYFLEGVKRTTDENFINWSNLMREGNKAALDSDGEFIQFVNKNRNRSNDEDYHEYVKLVSTNNEADMINQQKQSELDGEEIVFKGQFNLTNDARLLKNYEYLKEDDFYKNIIPNKTTKLKIGDRVMTVVNSVNGDYVNGDLGTIIDFIYDSEEGCKLPLMHIDSTKENVLIKPHTFKFEEKIGTEFLVVATITQVPLRLAYAITVHKSQGLSISKVSIDFSRFFLPEQGYVAFTRASDPKHVEIINFNSSIFKGLNTTKDFFYKRVIPFQNQLIDTNGIKFNWDAVIQQNKGDLGVDLQF